jgi:hypothetical protein
MSLLSAVPIVVLIRRVAAGLLFAVAIAEAQSPPPTTKSLCWAPKQLPECRSWVVTDFSFEYGVISTRVEGWDPDFQQRWSLTLGRMTNVSPRVARGFTGSVGLADYGDRGLPFRAEFRQRWWKSATLATEASAGLATQYIVSIEDGPVRANGITARLGVEYDWIGLDARSDILHAGDRTATGVSVGLKATSKQGTTAFAVFGAGILALIILVASASWD